MIGKRASRRWSGVLAAGLVLAGAAAAHAQNRPRVAVVNFGNNSAWTWWGDNLGSAAADEMTTQLVQLGKFTVLERAQIGAILAEQSLGASFVVANLLGCSVRVLDKHLIVAALDHHHGGAELFFRRLVQVVDERAELLQCLLLEVQQVVIFGRLQQVITRCWSRCVGNGRLGGGQTTGGRAVSIG